jgi:hypothetical protein
MSLIVAKKVQNAFLLVSDTKLTHPVSSAIKKYENHLHLGTVKTVVLHDRICLAWAGCAVEADDMLRKITSSNSFDEILNIILESTDGSADYILVSGEDSRMLEIKDGTPRETDNCWIGNIDGFSRFQSIFLSEEQKGIEEAMNLSMEKVVSDDSIPDVGGIHLMLRFTPSVGFHFSSWLKGYGSHIPIQVTSPSMTLGHGSNVNGDFTVHILETYDNVAIHFPLINKGLIFSREARGIMIGSILNDVDQDRFVSIVRNICSVTEYVKLT